MYIVDLSLLWLPAWWLGPVQKHAAAPFYSLWFQTDGPRDEPEENIHEFRIIAFFYMSPAIKHLLSAHDQFFMLKLIKTPFPSWELPSGHFASSPSSEGPWRRRAHPKATEIRGGEREYELNALWQEGHTQRRRTRGHTVAWRRAGLKMSTGKRQVSQIENGSVLARWEFTRWMKRYTVSSRDQTWGDSSLENSFQSLHSHHLLLFLRPETVITFNYITFFSRKTA